MTTSVNNGKTLLDPQQYDMLLSLKQDIFRSLNCAKVGQIQSFDPTRKTAKVQILFKRVIPDPNGSGGQVIQDYPLLLDVPVFTLQGGGAALEMPIAAGDQCLVVFSDRNLDGWFKSGTAQAPFNARCHDISDGIALVGLNALTSGLEDYESDKVRLFYQGAQVILAGGLLSLRNETTSLLTLLQTLATILEGATIDTTHGVFSGATIGELQTWALQLQELLQ